MSDITIGQRKAKVLAGLSGRPAASRREPLVMASIGAVGAMLVLAGCTTTEPATTPTSAVAPTTSSAASGTDGSASSGSAAPTPSPTATNLPVVAVRPSQFAKIPLEVALNSVVVSGKLMTVTWTVRNKGTESWSIVNFFSDGIDQKGPDGTLVEGGEADGVYVLDAASSRRYLPARDKAMHCVCSNGLITAGVEPDQQATLEAVFQAPPTTVTTVDVSIPHTGTFTAVPVTRGPA